MKNLLYFGPYRYNNNFGLCSRNIIRALESIPELNLFTKHIFFNNPYENQTMVTVDDTYSINKYEHFDIAIQHAPIGMISDHKSIATKNIAMPLMDYTVDESMLTVLKKFDLVIIDDPTHAKILDELNIKYSILDYGFVPLNDIQYRFNMDYHNFNKKFYYIGNYKLEHNMIQKIIVAFLLAFRSRNDVSLILVLNDEDSETAKRSINDVIDHIYKKMEYKTTTPAVKYIVDSFDYNKLHAIHKFGDFNIGLYDNYHSGINHQLAALYNKPTIDIANTQYIRIPFTEGSSNNYKYSVLTSSLIENMQKSLSGNSTSITIPQKQNIKNILCL